MTDNELIKKLVYICQTSDILHGVTMLNNAAIICYRDTTGHIRAAPNRCKHQGGRFTKGEGCILTCARHGWRLDASTFGYLNPAESGIHQDEFVVEESSEGTVRFYELSLSRPWEQESRPRITLDSLEFFVRFYTHACTEIVCGSLRLFTDPWLVGPAFTRGWWLTQHPPENWLEQLSSADGIYISHSHSDHLNRHTLKLLAAKNPDIPIYVPQFENRVCELLLTELGFTSVRPTPFDRWVNFGVHGRFMILRDASGRDDSGILVEYRGHRLLNTVDSPNLNNGVLPKGIDLLMTNFAGGASGYPVCWGDLYTEEEISRICHKNREAFKVRIGETIQHVKPSAYIPFAGFFTEAHPSDADIRRLNIKNSPEEVCEYVKSRYPKIATWVPHPGATIDIGSGVYTPSPSKPVEAVYNFEPYITEIKNDLVTLQEIDAIKDYFRTAGFRSNLILHVIETNEDFSTTLREFMVDFHDVSFPASRPSREHRYLRMRVRADVFRHVLLHRLSWEEISIGFQARFFREPNIYNFDFWNHFQNKLAG